MDCAKIYLLTESILFGTFVEPKGSKGTKNYKKEQPQ